jgi:hypothetical protein
MISLESVGSFCNDREEVERLIGKVPVLAHAESRPRVPETNRALSS